MICVPFGYQLIAGTADVLTVGDRAGEDAGDVQTVAERSVGAVLQVERAVQADVGRVGAQPIHFDSAACAVELDDLVAQFLDYLIDGTLHQTCGAREGADQFGLLDSVALVDAGTVCPNCFDFTCHFYYNYLSEI